MRCEVIAIGTELLLGQITDTNSSWIGGELALAGIDSHYQTKVGDNLERMVACIRQALARSDAVITCGGLGPDPGRHHARGNLHGDGREPRSSSGNRRVHPADVRYAQSGHAR